MKLGALAFQATIVIGVTATVGYPEFRQSARPIVVWRTAGPLAPRPDLVAGDPRLAYGIATASLALTGPAGSEPDRSGWRSPSGRGAFGGAESALRVVPISGSVRTALNQPIPFAYIALRNVRTGRFEARIRADQDGDFDFGRLARGSYVAELLGSDGSVVAASELIGPGALDGAANIRLSGNATARALFGVAGTAADSTLTPFLASTASEPLGRAADAGLQQTTGPDAAASPRN